MYTLDQTERFEQDIRKSRFLAVACPVDTEAEAKARLAEVSDPSANHNCWAWRIGQAYRFSDDGEPSGTAGKPILQAIDGQALDRTLVVVTRWFGGILLGGGGLIRAYGGTAAACLRAAEKQPLVVTQEATILCGFGDLALLQARLAAWPTTRVTSQTFTETGGELVVAIQQDDVEAVRQLVADLTSGRAAMRLAD